MKNKILYLMISVAFLTIACDDVYFKVVHVTEITLDHNNLVLTVGENRKLIATVHPSDATEKTVYWYSHNPNVATVDKDGNIIGKTPGFTIILVASKELRNEPLYLDEDPFYDYFGANQGWFYDLYGRQVDRTYYNYAYCVVSVQYDNSVYLLSEISGRDGRTTIEYDNQDRITKMTDYNKEGVADRVETYSYNNSGDLISMKSENYDGNSETYTFSRYGNKVTVENSSNDFYEESIDLNAQGLPVQRMYIRRIQNLERFLHGLTTYQYQNGNLVKSDWESKWQDTNGNFHSMSSGTGTYTYDDKMSLFYHCKTPKWFLIWRFDTFGSQNNVLTLKDNTYIQTFVYTYNDGGFPITLKTKAPDYEEDHTFKYERK